jgi:hypothetical protein
VRARSGPQLRLHAPATRCHRGTDLFDNRCNMTVAANISVSLDGYFAGPDASPSQMLGASGEVLRPEFERAGTMIMGRDSYEIAESAWGPHPPFENPTFVPTHRAREDDVREGSTFTFVTDGFDAALDRARAAPATRTCCSMAAPRSSRAARRRCSTSCSCTSSRHCWGEAAGCWRTSVTSRSVWSPCEHWRAPTSRT